MSEKFLRIGENLNVVTKVYGQAMKDRNPKPIQDLVIKEAEKGVDYIDVNIGPARKGGEELMEWIVKTIQEVVPNIPLALDTSNIAAMEAGLKVHKGKALINSIMARPERMDAMMPLVKKYDADLRRNTTSPTNPSGLTPLSRPSTSSSSSWWPTWNI